MMGHSIYWAWMKAALRVNRSVQVTLKGFLMAPSSMMALKTKCQMVLETVSTMDCLMVVETPMVTPKAPMKWRDTETVSKTASKTRLAMH